MFYELIQNTSSIQNSLSNVVHSTPLLASFDFDFSKITGDAVILSILGYSVVFIALVFLFGTFTFLAKAINYNIKSKLKKTTSTNEDKAESTEHISGETTAAISAALALHFRDVHDFEHTVITIKKVQKRYSPWSSKIYGLREYPRK